MLLFLIYWTSMEYIYIEISCLNTSLMKNIAVVILLWILIREKNDLWNFLLPHLCVCVCLCVCVSLSLYMIRNLCDLIKFNIENMWVDSKSLFWKKNLKETVNKLIWLTQDLFSLKTLIFPAQCIYFTIKYILVCFWFSEKKNKKKQQQNPLKWIQECLLLSFSTARFQAFWKSIVIVASLRSTSSYRTQKSTHGDGSLIRGTTILTSGCLKIIKTCVLEERFQ